MWRKSLSLFFVLCMLLLGLDRLAHHDVLIPGPKNIFTAYTDPMWEIPSSDMEDFTALDPIFKQTFTYFSKGSQSYVYLSEDGQHVLKFLKQEKLHPKTWLAYLPLPFNPYYHKRKALAIKRDRTFAAIQIATQQFKEETGILYAHLTASQPFPYSVNLIDRHGIAHTVDLNRTNCIIQKRAQLIYPRIDELMQEGDLPRATQVIHSLFQLLSYLGQQGVIDNDPIIRKNFGLIDDRAIQIDIGRLRIDPLCVGGDQYRHELRSITHNLKKWIATHHPTLTPIFEEALKAHATCH